MSDVVLRPEPLRMLELCAGYGGFSLALRGIARTVCFVERDSYAAATLVARMDEARLDQAPIWSDLTTFDARAWRGRVDLITAGFPCQPFSAAGKRLGTDDDRWLWPDIARIIRDVEPRYVFLENVPGVVRAGLAHVLGDLAQYGFDAEWGLYAASDVGAPHRRQRFWLVAELADAANGGRSRGRIPSRPVGEAVALPVGTCQGCAGEDVADTASVDEREPHHQGRTLTRHDTRPDIGGHRFPPRPDDLDGWDQWDGPQPGIRRGADGSTEWLADALHLGGNGLVPQCAREAWLQLTERFGGD